jgi:hypothetical protein
VFARWQFDGARQAEQGAAIGTEMSNGKQAAREQSDAGRAKMGREYSGREFPPRVELAGGAGGGGR